MPAKQAWHVVWNQRRVLLHCLAITLLGLWVSSVDRSRPERDLAAELRMLLLTIPAGLLWLVEHVRRRRPELLAKLTRALAILFTMRVLIFLILMRISLVVWPEMQGNLGDDSYYGGFLIRSVLVYLGGEDETYRKEAKLGVGGWIWAFGLEGGQLGNLNLRKVFLSHVGATAALCLLTGYSVVAATLPFIMISVCFVIQSYLLLFRFLGPPAARRTVIWLAFGPDYIVLGLGIMKDFATAIAMLYLCEFFWDGTAARPRRRWLWLLPVTAWAYVARPDSWPMIPGMAALFWFRSVWRPDDRRVDWAVALLAIAVGRMFSQQMPRWSLFATYEECLLGYVFFTPLFNLSVVSIDRNPSFHLIAETPLSLLWPLIISVVLVGLTRLKTGRIRMPSPLIAWIVCWLAIVTMSGFGLLHRFRVPVEPLIFALASECFDAIRAEPLRRRKRLVAAAGLIMFMLYAVSAGLLMLTELGR